MAQLGQKVWADYVKRRANPKATWAETALTADEKRAVEEWLDRPLTRDEISYAALPHEDNRDWNQRNADENWQPKPTPQPAPTVTEQLLAEAEREAFEEALSRMTPAEKQLARLKQQHLAELAAKADAAAHAEHLAKPAISKPLAALRSLLAEYELNPAVAVLEINRVRQAIAQFETPGADLAHAKQLFNGVRQAEALRVGAIKSAASEKLAAAHADALAAEASYKSLFDEPGLQTAEEPAENPLAVARHKALDEANATLKAYEDAKAAGADSAAVSAARTSWNEASQRWQAAKQAHEAEQSTK